jgi:hypothetical protein
VQRSSPGNPHFLHVLYCYILGFPGNATMKQTYPHYNETDASIQQCNQALNNVTKLWLSSIATILSTTDLYFSLVLDLVCEWTARKSIVGANELQFNDGIYAEVPLWCASGPIARRRIDLVCLEAFWLQEWEWVLEDCHRRSCWKNPIGISVPRLCRSDVYVCSKSFRLCLTVVYWLLECNKVPSWI